MAVYWLYTVYQYLYHYYYHYLSFIYYYHCYITYPPKEPTILSYVLPGRITPATQSCKKRQVGNLDVHLPGCNCSSIKTLYLDQMDSVGDGWIWEPSPRSCWHLLTSWFCYGFMDWEILCTKQLLQTTVGCPLGSAWGFLFWQTFLAGKMEVDLVGRMGIRIPMFWVSEKSSAFVTFSPVCCEKDRRSAFFEKGSQKEEIW